MLPRRKSWFDEDDGDLQVFVPGLMATGILFSIGMLLWDAVKRFLPDIGRRQRAIKLELRAVGRATDLMAIEQGVAPTSTRFDRVLRKPISAFLHATAAFVAVIGVVILTLEAYNAPAGTLSGRGWTLTLGLGAASVMGLLGALWLLSAIMRRSQPRWLVRAQAHWPVGVLPDPTEGDS